MSIPWVVKYQPTKFSEFVGNGESVRQLVKWLRLWEKKSPAKKGAFLYGPPGVGKTLSVYVLAKEFGYDTIEMNAGDWRTKKAIERIVGTAVSQSTLYGLSRRIVMIDELEGISGTGDREGLKALTKIVRTTLSPVVFIADDAWNPRFGELRNYCKLIQFKRIQTRSIIPYLHRICEKEGLDAESKALQLIAERSGGDLRSAIIDLQSLSQGKIQLTNEDVNLLYVRDRHEAIFNVLKSIFTADNCVSARKAQDIADVDYKMLFEWIYENAPYQLTDRQDLCDAMDALAKADIYFHRIRASQNWKLLPYALDMMTAAVAMSRKKTRPAWVPFKFPQRIRLMSNTRNDRRRKHAIGLKLGAKCHVSANTAVTEYLPYLKIIFSNDNGLFSSRIAEELGLNEEAITYLKGKPK